MEWGTQPVDKTIANLIVIYEQPLRRLAIFFAWAMSWTVQSSPLELVYTHPITHQKQIFVFIFQH